MTAPLDRVQRSVAHLRRCSDETRLNAVRELVPAGYVVSSPEREQQIGRMATTLEVFASRPTQYNADAERPQDRDEDPV